MTAEPRPITLAPDRAAALNLDAELTLAELPVVHWLAHGLTNKQIAERAFLTEATVKTHLHHIGVLAGARSRAHLIVWAYEKGYFVPGATGRCSDTAELFPHQAEPPTPHESVSLAEWCERLRTARADLDALLTRLGQR